MKLKKDQWILLGAGLAATLLMSVLFLVRPQFLRLLDYKLYDQFLIWHHSDAATDIPVIVDIDEKSLANYGQWPWPRYRVAILLQRLRKLGAVSVAMDVLFAESDKTSPEALKKAWRRDLQIDFDFSGLPHGLRDNDRLLADNLRTGPFILGNDFISGSDRLTSGSSTEDSQCILKPVTVTVLSDQDAPSPHKLLGGMKRAICPIPILAATAPATGFITITADEDSIYRRTPLLISYKDKFYPSLALASLMQATGINSLTLKMSSIGIESLRLGKYVIPLDQNGRMLINYRGPSHTFEYISAADVLSGKVAPGALDGRMIFIGTSASGLRDIRSMPLDTGFPGVETHATVADNILSGQFIRMPDWTVAAELSFMVLAGILTSLLLIWASAAWVTVPVIAMALFVWFGSVYWYTQYRIYLSPIYSLLSLLLTFTLLTTIKFWREEREKRFIHGAFAHYLAPSVISQIMGNPGVLTLEGQERDVSIQFSDIRNFTALSETLTPSQVTELLHEYLTPMTRIITSHEGTLDKFIGDAVMAFWNAPLDISDYQAKALNAALAQLETLDELNREFKRKYGFAINIGIGLHAGSVRVGNMGSADLFDYTLIGDNVNLASRLEGLTKIYGQRLVVSDTIATACTEMCHFRQLDTVRVKGRHEPIAIFAAHTAKEAETRKEEFKAYNKAYNLYHNGQFTKAGELFSQLNALNTEPLLYTLFIDRCSMLEEQDVGEEWDGVFTHESK